MTNSDPPEVLELDDGLVALSFARRPRSWPAELTEAERTIAALVLDGASNVEIAERRGCSPRTVANQLAKTYEKLGVSSRAELVVRLLGRPAGEVST